MMDMARVKVPFNNPLQERDTENTTVGCMANNPDICSNNGLEGVCAFTSKDGICKKSSRAWKKQYEKLLRNEVPA